MQTTLSHIVEIAHTSNIDQIVLKNALGRVITGIELVDNKRLRFSFDGYSLEFYDGGQSCCEYRHMNCDDDLPYYVGTMLFAANLKGSESKDDSGGYIECQFLEITTSKGSFTVANYNEHNGYYGGFDIEVYGGER